MSLKDTDENSSTMNFDDSSWDNSANEISSNTWDTLNDQLRFLISSTHRHYSKPVNLVILSVILERLPPLYKQGLFQ